MIMQSNQKKEIINREGVMDTSVQGYIQNYVIDSHKNIDCIYSLDCKNFIYFNIVVYTIKTFTRIGTASAMS